MNKCLQNLKTMAVGLSLNKWGKQVIKNCKASIKKH